MLHNILFKGLIKIQLYFIQKKLSFEGVNFNDLAFVSEIRTILDDSVLYEKYEDFMVRRVLAVDPDTRWCPAPDCR